MVALLALCLPLFLEARSELSTGGCDIVSALRAYAIADAMLKEDVAKRANGLWPWRLITGRGSIDRDAIHMGVLL